MNEIVLMADARVGSIPVQDNGEPLVDMRLRDDLRLDTLWADPHGHYAHLRADVVARLEQAQETLPDGIRLLIVEGFRPAALQRHYFDEYVDELRPLHPELSPHELNALASRYVSPPEVAPHTAGAAVDLTLCDANGTELDMGTRINASPEESEGRCYTDAEGLWPAAQANRDILSHALASVGLVNYPTEWWHWSYGDRYWALAAGAPAALYGPLN